MFLGTNISLLRTFCLVILAVGIGQHKTWTAGKLSCWSGGTWPYPFVAGLVGAMHLIEVNAFPEASQFCANISSKLDINLVNPWAIA